MKKMRLILAMMTLMAGAAFIASCGGSDDPEPPTEYTMNVSPEKLDFFAEGGTKPFNITGTAPGPFVATESQDWITTTVNNKVVSVTVSENETGAERTGTVTVTYENLTPRTVTITQSGEVEPGSLTPNPSSLTFDSNGGSKSISVTTQKVEDWTVESSDESWLTVSRSGNTVNVTASPYSGSTDRDAKIIFKSDDLDENVEVEVTQTKYTATTYTLSDVEYYGNSGNNSAAFLMYVGTSNGSELLVIEGFATMAEFNNFRLDEGEYTMATTQAPRTFTRGSSSGSQVSPACWISDSEAIYFTEGTFTVATGRTTFNFKGTSIITNTTVEREYIFEGDYNYINSGPPSGIEWLIGSWNVTGDAMFDGRNNYSARLNMKAQGYGNQEQTIYLVGLEDWNPDNSNIAPPLFLETYLQNNTVALGNGWKVVTDLEDGQGNAVYMVQRLGHIDPTDPESFLMPASTSFPEPFYNVATGQNNLEFSGYRIEGQSVGVAILIAYESTNQLAGWVAYPLDNIKMAKQAASSTKNSPKVGYVSYEESANRTWNKEVLRAEKIEFTEALTIPMAPKLVELRKRK